MRSLWTQALVGTLAGTANAGAPFLREAMQGGRVSGYDHSPAPDWQPTFLDESPPHEGKQLAHAGDWKVECTGTADGSSCGDLVDGKRSTAWRSPADGQAHTVTVELPALHNLNAVVVLPPEDASAAEGGLVTAHEIYVSADGVNWGDYVAHGMWPDVNRQRMGVFEPVAARFVKLVAKPHSSGSPEGPGDDDGDDDHKAVSWHGIAEIALFATSFVTPKNPKRGAWGPTLDLPVVPVSGAQEASGHIVLWSSWANDQFHSTPGGSTAMSRWDVGSGEVSKRIVNNTQHDMFCPGISIDGTGMMVVTGGNDASETSLFDGIKNQWIKGPEMVLRRGYQASTTLSDGRVFTIGGSWAGGSNVAKDGEVYDPAARNWTFLPGAQVKPMLTDDMEGAWRADNHGWLFGWKDGSVFQAGPSRHMNWYYAEGKGRTEPAGLRLEDEDSMSGNAVMFDAVQGKILTVGGSPDYDKSWATPNAHVITLGEPGAAPQVRRAARGRGAMRTERVFHTSVVLPDGQVFIAGGQDFGVAFNEDNARFVPEIYDPARDTFTELQPNNFIRVYHSVSILLPDARVLNAGGGLCGNCSANHYDGQVFTPPYLLKPDGTERARPVVQTRLPPRADPGQRLTFRAAGPVKHASLVRLCSATHTVNTDQRRVPLKLRRSASGPKHTYEFTLPSDSGILIPGYWMFFVMDARGTPSVAQTVMITTGHSIDRGEEDSYDQGVETAATAAPEDLKELRSAAAADGDCERGPLGVCWRFWKPTFVIQLLRRN